MDADIQEMRGSREPKDITIETYSNSAETPTPILPVFESQKSCVIQSTSRENSEEKSISKFSLNKNDEVSGATSSSPDQISFISGNPFVEVTKGIMHLFKEKQV